LRAHHDRHSTASAQISDDHHSGDCRSWGTDDGARVYCDVALGLVILLRVPLHRRTCRTLHFQPVRRVAGAIARILALTHDPFQRRLAGLPEHGLPVVEFQMLVESDAGAGFGENRGERRLPDLRGSRRRSSPFSCTGTHSRHFGDTEYPRCHGRHRLIVDNAGPRQPLTADHHGPPPRGDRKRDRLSRF
jgi:hypothetical protein